MEDIITPSEVAALLRIHVKTVYKLAEGGLIPGKRIGRNWRFRKSSILGLVSNPQRNRQEGEDSSTDQRSARHS